MYITISFYDFQDAFNNLRPDNFSYEGLKSLFEYYEQLEEDTGKPIELDVIAICCEWTECTIKEACEDYSMPFSEIGGKTTVIYIDDLVNQCNVDEPQNENCMVLYINF